MPKYKVQGTAKTVTLDKSTFKAAGGEGAIHIIGDTVYKICDSGKMIPEGKLKELAVLSHKRIIKPKEVILDAKNKPVGYTMDLVPGNAIPLAQMLTKAYREREGVKPDMIANLVKQIQDGISHIHSHKGYLQVDGNEFNYMIANNHKDAYFIDVNSFQTPNYPADAIMPSIRDWSCPQDAITKLYQWSELTDWYSFAIVSWYMFTAIQPFKGRHPKFPNMKTLMIDQMRAGVSVLDPESSFPKGAVYYPFENFIPGGKDGAYFQWYRALFCDQKRLPPPRDFQSIIGVIQTIQKIVGSNNFNISEVGQFASQIIGYYQKANKEVVVTNNELYVQNQPRTKPNEKFRVGFTPVTVTPLALVQENGRAKILNLETQTWLAFDQPANDIMSCEGRLYIHYEQQFYELIFVEQFGILNFLQKPVCQVLPNATQIYQGVIFQDMFGTKIASIFPETGQHRQFKIDELIGSRIIDAKYERNVLMILVLEIATGQYNRFVFRFAKDWSNYDVRKIENVLASGLNFTVLDTGICASITEEESVEIFSNQKDSTSIKSINDPAIKANMRLCHSGQQVRFALNDKLYNISVKK